MIEPHAIIIGVAGGTGSGKTSIAKAIKQEIGDDGVVIVEQDSYYHNLTHLPIDERARINFDHPDSIDFDLMRNDLEALQRFEPVELPIYDYTTHTRKTETRNISGHRLIILEGILVLFDQAIRDLMNIKIYIDTPADVRFIRRMMRDVQERDRSFDAVVDQYYATVRPMHDQFVEPTKRFADIIIPEGGHNRVAIDLLKTKVDSLLNDLKKRQVALTS